ncbi:MAG: aminotransferase class I/II-fold pyridoxal phosphate-dependent enzyme [Patescibacteria group bacterium]
MIPFVDLKTQYQSLKNEISEAVSGVLEKTNFILGEPVTKFEEDFASFCNSKYCVGVSSGTDALCLALKALDISSKDEVIIPANTFIATAIAVSQTGATPVLADVDHITFNLDLDKLESKITAKTKVIIPVHLYGRMVDMEKLISIANKHNLKVVEDACQAHGATWKNKPAGSYGDIGCFSFYPGKNLGAYGDAGAVVTSDEAIYEKVKMLRNYGSKVKYHHDIIGYNNRMDTIQAAILNVKLKYLPDWNNKRLNNARLYNQKLSDIKEIILPRIPEESNRHVFHLYVIRAQKRDELLKYINDNGVQAGIHYPIPIYSLGAYTDLKLNKTDFKLTEQLSQEIISLPMFAELSLEQIETVSDLIKKFYQTEQFNNNFQFNPVNKKESINFGLIGYGYWGPNFARDINESKNGHLKYGADLSEVNLKKIKEKYPQVIATSDYHDILRDQSIDAVIVATPTKTHYQIVKEAILAKKHVFVEKPMCYKVEEAKELVDLAQANGVKLMVGHIFLFNPAVNYIKKIIDEGQIGKLRHLHFQRRNLGPIRQDINVMWDLAPHDISMVLYFINKMPISVVASGETFLQNGKPGMYDVVSVSLKFPDNIIANMVFSWIDPIKIRDMTIVGAQKMILFDDVNQSEKIKIFNKNASVLENTRDVTFGEYQININNGDISIPSIDQREPLKEEINHFIDCVINNKQPLTDGFNGLIVVKVLSALQESLDNNSQLITLS